MTREYSAPEPLHVSSLAELWEHEDEIVRRIRAMPNGGKLLLCDPQRLLRELHVEIATHAVDACRAAHPEFFARTGRETLYDTVARSLPGSGIDIAVSGLFQKGSK